MPWFVGAIRNTLGRVSAVDEAGAAVVGDADRHPIALGDLPRGVDACSVGDDRDRVRIERPTRVLDRLPRREVVVVELDGDPVALLARPDAAARVQVAVANSRPWRIVCATYGLPVTGTVDCHGQVPRSVLLLELLPHPDASRGQAHEKGTDPDARAEAYSRAVPRYASWTTPLAATSATEPSRHDGAGREDEHSVGDPPDQAEVVLDHEERDAALADAADRVRDGVELVCSRPGRQLVDEEHLRRGRQRCGQRDEAALRSGQLERLRVRPRPQAR
jgi:hypothetical protein